MTLLVFDCDGTLVESELLHAQVELDYLRQRFGYENTLEDHNKLYAGIGMRSVMDEVAGKAGHAVSPDIEDEISAIKQKAFSGRIVPIPHVFETLDALGDFPRCVASNAETALLRSVLTDTGLLDKFAPHVFSARMVPQPKPAPDLFLYAAKTMKTAPDDCIVIEDSIHGVAAAQAAGMRVLGFAGGAHCYPGYIDKLRGADRVFTDMRELPQLILSMQQ